MNKKIKSIYGVVGNPLGQSLSPVIQTAALKVAGLPGEYGRFELESPAFDGFMKDLRKNHFAGLTVTMPFKQVIIPYLDELDPTAKLIGAVNTVEITPTKLIGHNTDYVGAIRALEDHVELKSKRVLLLGFGGAAKAIIYGLNEKDAQVTIYAPEFFSDEKRETNKNSRDSSPVAYVPISFDAIRGNNYDIIINATPVGMAPNSDRSVLSSDQLKGCPLVMDIVYKPRMTKLLREAASVGATTITGDRMLLYQGARQFEIWHRQPAPLEAMDAALQKAIATY
ncbi:shikimate dehydrogenase [Candidatus Peregrinibacteria bacterium]|nr:shikimate dehydrogenase [Candidatus Peregrinibacteria bacterium]